MKILNLKIISPNNKIIRNIDFNENGISIIFGDILTPEDKTKTSNSLGKSLLLKFIDYIYGANNDKTIVPDILNDYILNAVVKFKEKKYTIKRNLKSSSDIIINDKIYTLEKYKIFFEIDRSLYHKQIILQPRLGLISYKKSPEKEDIINFIKLLGLENLLEETEKIYTCQDEISKLKEAKKQMSNFFNETEEIDEKVFLLNKEIKKLENEVTELSDKIKNLQTSKIKENVIEEYQMKNIEFKEKKEIIFSNELEIKRMKKFLEEYKNVDVSSKTILSLYNKAKIEIPELIKRKIEEVEVFHKNVYSDRKNILNKRINLLLSSQKEKYNELEQLKKDLDYLGSIISENKIYKENMELYEKFSLELKEKKYEQGQFSQIGNVINKIKDEDNCLVTYFNELKILLSQEKNKLKIKDFQDFIYDFTQDIYKYEEKNTSYFNFDVRNKHQKTRPFKLDIKINYDGGEGIGQVKKVMTDILILKFNKILDFFIQDSNAYVGIDPRQVTNIIFKINNISYNLNKQAIISINKYQLTSEPETLDFLKKYEVISVSENDKLLKINF